jgi:hypothetical protein
MQVLQEQYRTLEQQLEEEKLQQVRACYEQFAVNSL